MRRTSFSPNSPNLTDKQRAQSQVLKFVGQLKYIDIQAACIVRGMDFQDMAEADIGGLETYLLHNFDNDSDRALLEEYDIWVDQKLALKYDEDHPLRHYKKFSIWSEEGEVVVNTKKLKKAGVPLKKKVKAKRNSKFNIISGTKKEYTHTLCQSLYEKFHEKYDNKTIVKKFAVQLVVKVTSKFGEANEKSIKIWMKRAIDALSSNK
jgi:hypothetical protein